MLFYVVALLYFINFKLRHICVFSIKKNMDSKKNLVILGQMAVGKSTIGALIAKKLGLKFYDTDKIIENEVNMSVADNILEKLSVALIDILIPRNATRT